MHDKQRINTGIVHDDSKKKKHKEADKNKRTDYITDHKTKKQKSSYCIEQLDEQHHTNSILSEQSTKKKEKHREKENSETKQHYDNTKLTENSNDVALKSNLTKLFDCFQDVSDSSNSSVETSRHKKTVSPAKKDLNSSDKKSIQKNDSNSYARQSSFDNVIIHDHSLKNHNLQTVKHAKKSFKHDESRSSPKKKLSESISDSTHNTHIFFDKKENSHRNDETNKVEVDKNKIIKKEISSDWSDTNTPVKKQHTNSNGLITPENHSELKKRKKKKKSHGDHFYLSDTLTPVKNHSDSDHAKKKKKKSHKNDKIANIGDDCKDSSLETHKSVKNKSSCNESIDLSPTNTPDFELMKRKKKKKLHRDYETDNVEVDSENGSLKKNTSVKKRKRSLNGDFDANTPPKKQLFYTDDRNELIPQDNQSNLEFVKRKKKEKNHTDSESSRGGDQLPKKKKKEKVHSFKSNGSLDKFKIKQELGVEDLAWDYDLMRDQLDLHHKERISDEHKAMLQQLVVDIPWPVPESHLIETRMSTHPSKAQQAKFIELGLDMKRDHYTLDEDDKILQNWDKFCKLHDLPNDPQPFFAFEATRDSKIKGSVLPKIQRINFVRFLGHGLSHRCLFSIYRRFKKLFEPTKKGKFSREEDAIIMNFVKHSLEANKFAQLAVLLNRDRHAILLRHKKLARNTMSPIRVCQTLYR